MPGSETPKHLGLKRLALGWAQQQGFSIAGVEVSVPRLGCCRLDAAAARIEGAAADGLPRPPVTAIFECKQSRADFLRDSRCESPLTERLAHLHELKLLYEESMRSHFPSLRQGDALFPEFGGYRFEAAGFAPYEQIVAELRKLTHHLHSQTKFGKLMRWNAANVCYVVAEVGVARPAEIPHGWGLLVRSEEILQIVVPALWRDVADAHRWELLLRIAKSGTREAHHRLGLGSSRALQAENP